MNNKVVLMAAAVLLGTVSFAQTAGPKGGAPGGKPGGPGQGQRMGGARQFEKKIFDQLGLSAAQKSKIEALQKSRMDKMKALRDKMQAGGQKPDRQAMGATFKKMQDEYQASLKGILSAAQFKKYQDLMKAEMEKFRKEHPGGPGGPGGPGAGGQRGGAKGGKAGGGF